MNNKIRFRFRWIGFILVVLGMTMSACQEGGGNHLSSDLVSNPKSAQKNDKTGPVIQFDTSPVNPSIRERQAVSRSHTTAKAIKASSQKPWW